jgi:hypothetical protein
MEKFGSGIQDKRSESTILSIILFINVHILRKKLLHVKTLIPRYFLFP